MGNKFWLKPGAGLPRLFAACCAAGALVLMSGGAALAHKNVSQTAIAYSANPVNAGTIVVITATVTFTGAQAAGSDSGHTLYPTSGDPVVGDTVQIQQLQLAGVGVPCGTVGGAYVNIASGATNVSGQFTANFDTTGLAGNTICFRAHHPDGGGAHGAGQSASPGVDLVINAAAACAPGETGAVIAATFADGDGAPAPGDSGPWTFRITVTACEDVFDVTAQGGSNGWAELVSWDEESGSAVIRNPDGANAKKHQNSKNRVLLWTIGAMNEGDEVSLDVVVDGTIPASAADCEVRYLSGPWSTSFYTVADGIVDPKPKSAYTGRISVTVDANGNPNDCI